MSRREGLKIRTIYRELTRVWGPQQWWPAETQFEVIVGAYLTQNTAWTNVRLAIKNLQNAECLTAAAMRSVSVERLEQLIRPAGYFRQKAQRLKTFISFLDGVYGGDLGKMFLQQTDTLREQLLALNGVGPETADSILLYAGNHSVFVVDAYTRRVFERHAIIDAAASYEDIRHLVEKSLSDVVGQPFQIAQRSQLMNCGSGAAHPPSPMSMASRECLVQAFNEMHALIVSVGKNYCFKSDPSCESCPLRKFLPRRRSAEVTAAPA